MLFLHGDNPTLNTRKYRIQCSSEISDQCTRKMNALFLHIRVRHARVRHTWCLVLLFIAIDFLYVSLFVLTNDYEWLLFSNRNEYLFFCQNVHMPWSSDRSVKLTVNEIHCNLDSILESWLRIVHPCSTRVNNCLWHKSQQFITISFG